MPKREISDTTVRLPKMLRGHSRRWTDAAGHSTRRVVLVTFHVAVRARGRGVRVLLLSQQPRAGACVRELRGRLEGRP